MPQSARRRQLLSTAGANLRGTIPASLGTALPDLQLVDLRNNPGVLSLRAGSPSSEAATLHIAASKTLDFIRLTVGHVLKLECLSSLSQSRMQKTCCFRLAVLLATA